LLDFSGIANQTPEDLKADLGDELTKMGKKQGITVKGPSLESQLKALIGAVQKVLKSQKKSFLILAIQTSGRDF
jgi:ABC-type hemin transport system substrate-binding protein